MIGPQEGGKTVVTMVPIVANNDTEGKGVAVDRRGFGRAKMIALQGISGDTLSGSVKWAIKFQHSDTTTDGDFADIDAADLDGGANAHVIDAAAEDPTTIVRTYKGTKRYVRIFWDATGTHTNGTPIAGVIELTNPNYIPVTQPTELGG